MQSLHLVIGYTTVSSLQIEHGLVLIMAGSDAAEMHGPAFGYGGHGEPIFFGLFRVTTTIVAPVDLGIACGWPLFINPSEKETSHKFY